MNKVFQKSQAVTDESIMDLKMRIAIAGTSYIGLSNGLLLSTNIVIKILMSLNHFTKRGL